MADMVLKQADVLMDLYEKKYKEMYNAKPMMNRNTDVWKFANMIKSLGIRKAKEVMYFYLDNGKPSHSVQQLATTYEKLAKRMTELAEDKEWRLEESKRTAERVREYEAKHGRP